mgnify:CR=1 FL=1
MLREITNDEIYEITIIYQFYTELFSLIFGLIGNLMNLFVLNSLPIFHNNQCVFYIKIESIVNIGFLLTIYPANIVGFKINQNFTFLSIEWCKLKTTLSQTFGLISVYTVCFSAFHQYLSTSHRDSCRQMGTLNLARRLTIVTVCFCAIHSLLFLYFNEIQSTFTCTVYNSIFKQYLMFFYYPIINTGLPILGSASFGLLAYYNIRHIICRRIPIVRRRLDRQLTKMVLTRICCMIILGFPYIVFSIYLINLKYTGDNFREIAIATLTSAICYSLLYGNFSVKYFKD